MPLMSMTGFADLTGGSGDLDWIWEACSVNGRGFDLRLRLPEGFDGLEATLRAAAGRRLARGSVSVRLRLRQGARSGPVRLDLAALDSAVDAALAACKTASARGLDLAPMTAADLLGLRGVLEPETWAPADDPAVLTALTADADALIAALQDARTKEGAALAAILARQLDQIAALAVSGRDAAAARGPRQSETLRARVAAVLAAAETGTVDEARLAQELAVLAVRSDVTEELDRLDAHVSAGRALIRTEGPVGRKLDFLTQEFNRECNTLCAKAQSAELTVIGLEMKVVIDQMREQVKNVE